MRGILVTSSPIPVLDTASNRANDSALCSHPCHWRVHCTTPFSHALISSRCLWVFYNLFIRALWPLISNREVLTRRSVYAVEREGALTAIASLSAICAAAVLFLRYFF